MIRGHTLVIDYDFYVNSYLGSTIPEQAFGEMAARAVDALARMRRHYRVIAGDAVSEKMALCALAEAIYSHKGRNAGVTAATVGGVSVRYEGSRSLQRRLLDAVKIYLDVYRGAGNDV